jgi:protein-disulfide isomerase
MTANAIGNPHPLQPLDEHVDHVRGPVGGRVILEYGDYECPYSRRAFREIERVEHELGESVRFAFRHFPLTQIHPHALAAAAAAEAAARQDRFWNMHELLFHHQHALTDNDLHRYAAQLGLDLARFDRDRTSARSAATSTAAWRRVNCTAPRHCSSTAASTAATTPRPP